MSPAIVTLLTDFGVADAYVGAMKGALLAVAPGLTVVDLCHEVAPQDVFGGALILRHAAPFFPQRTVHLAVVDPGVGSSREPVVIETADALFVGPNNGLLSLAAAPPRQVWRLQNPAYRRPTVSRTFHGRDLFAPAAAFLADGTAPSSMGPQLPEEQVVQLELPVPRQQAGGLEGEIIHVDHFGNLVTNLQESALAPPCRVEVGGTTIEGVQESYYAVAPGALCAVIGSAGLLEVAVRDGSAAQRLGLARGARVRATRGAS